MRLSLPTVEPKTRVPSANPLSWRSLMRTEGRIPRRADTSAGVSNGEPVDIEMYVRMGQGQERNQRAAEVRWSKPGAVNGCLGLSAQLNGVARFVRVVSCLDQGCLVLCRGRRKLGDLSGGK